MKYVYLVILISASLSGMEDGLVEEKGKGAVITRLKKDLGSSFKDLSTKGLPKWRKRIDEKNIQKIIAIKSGQENVDPYYTIDIPVTKKKNKNKKRILVYENADLYKEDKFEEIISLLKKNFTSYQIYFLCTRFADGEK